MGEVRSVGIQLQTPRSLRPAPRCRRVQQVSQLLHTDYRLLNETRTDYATRIRCSACFKAGSRSLHAVLTKAHYSSIHCSQKRQHTTCSGLSSHHAVASSLARKPRPRPCPIPLVSCILTIGPWTRHLRAGSKVLLQATAKNSPTSCIRISTSKNQ